MTPVNQAREIQWELRPDGFYYVVGATGLNTRAVDVTFTFTDMETGEVVETQSYPKTTIYSGIKSYMDRQDYGISVTSPYVDYSSMIDGHYRAVKIWGTDLQTDGQGNFNANVMVQKHMKTLNHL